MCILLPYLWLTHRLQSSHPNQWGLYKIPSLSAITLNEYFGQVLMQFQVRQIKSNSFLIWGLNIHTNPPDFCWEQMDVLVPSKSLISAVNRLVGSTLFFVFICLSNSPAPLSAASQPVHWHQETFEQNSNKTVQRNCQWASLQIDIKSNR